MRDNLIFNDVVAQPTPHGGFCDKPINAEGLVDYYGRKLKGAAWCTFPYKHTGPCGLEKP